MRYRTILHGVQERPKAPAKQGLYINLKAQLELLRLPSVEVDAVVLKGKNLGYMRAWMNMWESVFVAVVEVERVVAAVVAVASKAAVAAEAGAHFVAQLHAEVHTVEVAAAVEKARSEAAQGTEYSSGPVFAGNLVAEGKLHGSLDSKMLLNLLLVFARVEP